MCLDVSPFLGGKLDYRDDKMVQNKEDVHMVHRDKFLHVEFLGVGYTLQSLHRNQSTTKKVQPPCWEPIFDKKNGFI